MPFDLPFDYVLATVAWLARGRQFAAARGRPKTLDWPARHGTAMGMVARARQRGQPGPFGLGFSGGLTAVELYFAVVYDASDAVNVTNVSKHWFQRHVVPFQKVLKFSDGQQTPYQDDAEFRRTLDVGERQISFIGDSFTLGHGVLRVADRFSDRIGTFKLLQKLPADSSFRTWPTLAVISIGSRHFYKKSSPTDCR